MFYKIIYSDTLSHHGILGQKWGKTNGPPYPLDAADHSAAEEKAGWKKSLSNDDKITRNRRRREAKENKQIEKTKKAAQRRWVRSYNTAAIEFNKKLGEINKKYPGVSWPFDTPEGQKYIREVNSVWQTTYKNVVISQYGEKIMNNGEEWLSSMPAYNAYVSLIVEHSKNS